MSAFQPLCVISDDCGFLEEDGFIKTTCNRQYNLATYKCVGSNTYYSVIKHQSFGFFTQHGIHVERSRDDRRITKSCPNDPRHYQACSDLFLFVSTHSLLQKYAQSSSTTLCGMTVVQLKGQVADKFSYKIDLDVREVNELLKDKFKCDGICEESSCEDEIYCNGFLYGFFCDSYSFDNTSETLVKGKVLVAAQFICDGKNASCISNEDEKNCSNYERRMTSEFGHTDDDNIEWRNKIIRHRLCSTIHYSVRYTFRRLSNITRCSGLVEEMVGATNFLNHTIRYRPHCEYYMDQTNCSDSSRGVVECLISGYPSTVSKFATCVQTPGLCDDGFDNVCVDTSNICFVHKHQLCDGISDCNDQSDEMSRICKTKTISPCFRRYHHDKKLPIPISWLLDGLRDCQNGEDEKDTWPTCGTGIFRRYVPGDSKCEDVYMCSVGSQNFVRFNDLCDGQDMCGHARLCSESRNRETKNVYTSPVSIGKVRPLECVVHCVAGVSRSLGQFISSCEMKDFTPFPMLGLNGPPSIMVPKSIENCKNVFGKVYVYLTCSGRCTDNAMCPLQPLTYDACQFQDKNIHRAYTTTTGREISQLTFLQKDRTTGLYENNNFQCKNNKCIKYNKVCNLADDCGDWSDEETCSNNFMCDYPKRFISKNQKCDDKIDCSDFTDECNEECGKTIISRGYLQVLSWVIGCSAVILNSAKVYQNAKILVTRKFSSASSYKALTTVIHAGDLITGLYLLTIAMVDSLVYGTSYCKERLNWLSSGTCAFLGVLSTFGGQVSLLSMTLLSFYRAMGIINVQKVTSKNSSVKISLIILMIVITSFCISFIPLSSRYEDFFVNGMTYDPKIKIFKAFVPKDEHVSIIRSYYGRISTHLVSTWAKINSLIDPMFSNQYDGTGRRKIHFYGNDGVCIFKYFVTSDDPQKAYVLGNLLLNIVCFLIISICYFKVLLSSKISKQRLIGDRDQNKRSEGKRKAERYIAIIVLTDFLCWVPFTLLCMLNFWQLVDATAFYPISSIVILPINSVLNPILYNNYVNSTVKWICINGRYWLAVYYRDYWIKLAPSSDTANVKSLKDEVNNGINKTTKSILGSNVLPEDDDETKTNNKQLNSSTIPRENNVEILTGESSTSNQMKNDTIPLDEKELELAVDASEAEKPQRTEMISDNFIILHRKGVISHLGTEQSETHSKDTTNDPRANFPTVKVEVVCKNKFSPIIASNSAKLKKELECIEEADDANDKTDNAEVIGQEEIICKDATTPLETMDKKDKIAQPQVTFTRGITDSESPTCSEKGSLFQRVLAFGRTTKNNITAHYSVPRNSQKATEMDANTDQK